MRRALLRDLHSALSNEEFDLEYQPLVNLETENICACEALLRWNHPKRGRVPPAEFIPILESSALILPVGEWVLRQACIEAANWPAPVRVSVNISAVQFEKPGFLRHVVDVLQISGLAAGRLELELTESVLLDDGKGAMTVLRDLHSMGVRIALDDFGTGYSSLSYLSTFPFDSIKIDRCFIRTLTKDNMSSRAIVRAVARLGSALGIETVAEGVETLEQVEIVRAEGCTSAQGFFYYAPASPTNVRALLSTPIAKPSQSSQGRSLQPFDNEEERLHALHQYEIMDTPTEDSFDRITRLAKSIMQAPVAMISFVDRDRQWFKSSIGTEVCETPRDVSFCSHTIQDDRPLIVPDTLLDPRFCSSPLVTGAMGIRSYIGVPLRTSTGHRIGALCVNDVNPREVTPDQIGRLQDLARLVVDELELRKLAAVDSLTGLATPRVFISHGKAAFNLARRHGRDLSCIAFDLDHFKQINDTHGHAAGDRVLTEVGNLCKALIRSTDSIGRMGGEEFAVLLPETPASTAAKVAEGIRKNIALMTVRHLDDEIQLTASCGVASLTVQDRSFSSMLVRADGAMYEAKEGGRNKVVAELSPSSPRVVAFKQSA
jgi:diguanylate cyclase (GGDEF)-like protein